MAKFSDYYRTCTPDQQHCLRTLLANIYFNDLCADLGKALFGQGFDDSKVADMNRVVFDVETWMTGEINTDDTVEIETQFLRSVDEDPKVKKLVDLIDRYRDETAHLQEVIRVDLVAKLAELIQAAFPEIAHELIPRLRSAEHELRSWHRETPEG